MQISNRTGAFLVLLAALLSAFNGFLSLLTVLVFSGHESSRLWASIYLPTVLWIAALSCYKLPRTGFIAYTTLLAASLFLCADPIHHAITGSVVWEQCASNLRFALFGGGLLLVNLAVPKRSILPIGRNL